MTHEEHLERQVIIAVKGIEGLRKLMMAAELRADAAEARAALAERQVRVLLCRAEEWCRLGGIAFDMGDELAEFGLSPDTQSSAQAAKGCGE